MDNPPPDTNIPKGKETTELSRPEKLRLGMAPIGISFLALGVSVVNFLYAWGLFRQIEDHEVVGRVLNIGAEARNVATVTTPIRQTTDFVDVAIINRGNQTEIIRGLFLEYSKPSDKTRSGRSGWSELKNFQLAKGEKKVVRLYVDPIMIEPGEEGRISVGVIAIAPNGSDVEAVWEACTSRPATADTRASTGVFDLAGAPLKEIISKKQFPHQKPAVGSPP